MSEIVDCIAWIVRKVAWSLQVCLLFLGKRLLDLLGLIFNLLACCTILRLPHMIVDLGRMDGDDSSWWVWRCLGIIHISIFILDLPFIVMGLFVLVTVVRAQSCLKEIKSEFTSWECNFFSYSGWELRQVVAKNFMNAWIDIFCLPTALIVLLSWRSVIFVRKMRVATADGRRKHCFYEFAQLILDILFLPFFISFLSWRLPLGIHNIRRSIEKELSWNNSIRYVGLKHFLLLLLDIPCMLLFIVTLFTWRMPLLVYHTRNAWASTSYSKEMKVRKTIVFQFALIFLDIPCIVAAVVAAISLFRLPSLILGIKRVIKGKKAYTVYRKEMKVRMICCKEFGMVFVDTACFVLFVVVICTLWRFYPLYKKIFKHIKKTRVVKVDSNDEATNTDTQQQHETIENRDNQEETEIPTNNEVMYGTFDEQVNAHDDGEPQAESHSEIMETEMKSERSNDELVVVYSPVIDQTSSGQNNPVPGVIDAGTNEKINTWKIRKYIAIEFGFLIIDLPAIPLFFLLLVTGLRTTKVISELLASDFYMMFAITVYHQFFAFLIELVFIVIFLFLAIRKPIHLWTVLLEDESHQKNRMLRYIMQWIPDIINDRHNYYARLNEIVALNFKQKNTYQVTQKHLDEKFEPYLNRLTKLKERLEKYEIEDRFCYLVSYCIFVEEKRTNKLLRMFETENNFLQRPNVQVYEANTTRLKNESRRYENEVKDIYDRLENYKPEKVPLYESKTGLSMRTRTETKWVLIKCLPRDDLLIAIGCLLCILPIYRAPTLIKKLVKSWYNRHEILKETLCEYAKDFLTVLRILLVIIFVYRAPFLLADVFDCIIRKRSWKAVRKVVAYYPGFIFEDVFNIVRNVLSWNSIRFTFTALLFGLFMPAELFLTVSKSWFAVQQYAYILTGLLYVIFMGFPFLFTYYGAEKIINSGFTDINIVVLCVFFIALFTIMLSLVTIVVRDPEKTFLIEMPEADYVRYTWYNVHVILFEILEFFQMMALFFKLSSIPMYGNEVLSTASKYLLFSFVSSNWIFYITIALFIVWFFLSGAPIIFENILDTYPIGTFGKRPIWRLAISLFANTLFVTFIESFVSFSACTYTNAPCLVDNFITNNTHLNNTYLNNTVTTSVTNNLTCVVSTFVEDTSLSCWSSPHRDYAVFTLVALVWYTSTALIFLTRYGDPDTSNQDIGFSPIYNTVINVMKALMVICVTIITNNPYVTLTCLLVLNTLSLLFTLLFKVIFKFYPCNVPAVVVWRIFTFASSCIVAVALLVAFAFNAENSKIPLIIIGAGIGLAFIVSVSVTIKLRHISKTEKEREVFRKEIQVLEERLQKNNWLLSGWEKKKKVWYRLIRSVHSAQKRDKWLTSKQPANEATKDVCHPPPHPSSLPAAQDITPPSCNEPTVSFSDSPDTPLPPDESLPPSNTPKISTRPSGEEATDLNLPPPPSFDAVRENQTFYTLSQVQSSQFPNDILTLEKNGRNLLFILEKYIDYKAYRYAFFTQRHLWLESAWHSDWSSLLQCLRVLNTNIQGTFHKPTSLDVSLAPVAIATDELKDDPQDLLDPPPPFIRQTKEMIEENSKQCRQNALNDMEAREVHGAELCILFERLLPDIPVIRTWEYDSNTFTLTLRRPVTGTITEIDSDGNKLAKGANIKIGKKLMGNIGDHEISFLNDGLVGSKGPVNITLKNVRFLKKKQKLYIEVNEKNKVPFQTVVSSSKVIKWM